MRTQASGPPLQLPKTAHKTAPHQRQEQAATILQQRYRSRLRNRRMPRMLNSRGSLLHAPKAIKTGPNQFNYAGQTLTISAIQCGQGANARIFEGQFNTLPVAVKIGKLAEFNHLEKLLNIQKNTTIPMVVPLPVSLWDNEQPRGIGLMPLMESDLRTYLKQHPAQTDTKRCEQIKIGDTLERHGIHHQDQTPENFLVDSHGRLFISDFGDIRSDAPEKKLTDVKTTPLSALLEPSHPAHPGYPELSGVDNTNDRSLMDNLMTFLRLFSGATSLRG